MSALCRFPGFVVTAVLAALTVTPGHAQIAFTDVSDALRDKVTPDLGFRGIAVGDYDNDGRADFAMLTGRGLGEFLLNNLGGGRFIERSSTLPDISVRRWSQVFGDYDGDGDLDLFVTVSLAQEDARNLLLRNDMGIFTNVAEAAGLTDVLNTRSAIWLDYDRDGHLDLYTSNVDTLPREGSSRLAPERNLLYRNLGDGTFADVTASVGLDLQLQEDGGGSGGMVAADFNNDGLPDLYVGVAGRRNRLFLANGNGGFNDVPLADIEDAESYGVAVGDIDNDGDMDILQTASGDLRTGLPGLAERSTLLLNLGDGQFIDVTNSAGLGRIANQQAQAPSLGDFDNDGDLDLLISNPPLLFANDGHGVFTNVTESSRLASGSGGGVVALLDFDRDGNLDVLSQGQLLRNNGNGHHFLRVRLAGRLSNRDGIGARVILTTRAGEQHREILAGTGISQDEMVAHFGLGNVRVAERLEIRWPSGERDLLTDVAADQQIRVIEGSGRFERDLPSHVDHLSPAVVADAAGFVTGRVWPALFDRDARVDRVYADLSRLGGASEVELESASDGSYTLNSKVTGAAAIGTEVITFTIEQQTALGKRWARLIREISVLPHDDQRVFADGIDGWRFFGELGTNITRNVAHDFNPDWSPVEDRILFHSIREGNQDIYSMDDHGGQLTRLTTDPRPDAWPKWSPDGSMISFFAPVGPRVGVNSSSEVLVMDADGGNQRQLTNDPASDYSNGWSPDGTKILFETFRDGNWELYVMGVDGSDPTNLSNDPYFDGRATWSPTGDKIAFQSDRAVEGGAGNDIYLMDADGSNQIRLTQTVERDKLGDWSPDGRQIVFEREVRPRSWDIFVMDADGSNERNVTNTFSTEFDATFSADGTKITFVATRDLNVEIYVLDLIDTTRVDLDSEHDTFEGAHSMRVVAEGDWELGFRPAAPFDATGYHALRFAFHPGTLNSRSDNRFLTLLERAFLDRPQVDLLHSQGGVKGIDLARPEWQVVTIPLELLGPNTPLSEIRLFGHLSGTFYIDDVRFVALTLDDVVHRETAVLETQDLPTPARFSLSQNFPNPFNPETTIHFDLPSSSEAELSLYNVSGQRVATLIRGFREMGSYTLRWDGTDDSGKALASGLYFYRLTAGERVETRKLMLLR